MSTSPARKLLIAAGIFLAALFFFRYLGPLLAPFLLGAFVALAAEPAVAFGISRLKLPRYLASGIGVATTLSLLFTTLWFLGALTVKELGQLAKALPNIQDTIDQGLTLLQDWLIGIADRAPDGLRALLTGLVLELFGSGSAFLTQLTGRLPGLLSSLLSWLPNGAVSLVTGVLAGFMISVRLPRIREFVAKKIPLRWQEQYIPAIAKLRKTLGAWLRAQLKLMGVTYGIVAVGLMLCRISYGAIWALPVALVDAVPVLGTGAVLIPWAVIVLLQGRTATAIGLLITWVAAVLTRTLLEPRFVGKQLGLDPLVTLLFVYAGYKLFGVFGMLLAPMLAAAVKSLTTNA